MLPFACHRALPLLAGAAVLPAQNLLRDINAGPATTIRSSEPARFVSLPNGRALFIATTLAHGSELWVTDGTAPGTQRLADLWPGPTGSGIRELVELSPGVVLFAASTPGTGSELFRTDGTAAGTRLVLDIQPGTMGSVPAGLLRVGNQLLFFCNDGVHGIEPWVTDGTAAGTRMLLDVVPGATGMSNGVAAIAALGANRAVFSALIGQQWQLFVTDLTVAGTQPYRLIGNSIQEAPRHLTALGARVLFSLGSASAAACWVTDGTAAGTFELGRAGIGGYAPAGSLAYFVPEDALFGREVWRTDGTVAGTGMVADLMPGGGLLGHSNPWLLGALAAPDRMLFCATTPSGPGLFVTDGTAAGTLAIGSAGNTGVHYGSAVGTVVGTEVWYRVAIGPAGQGLYRTDGTAAGTALVTTFATGAIGRAGGTVVLAADDGSGAGVELCTSDGTPGGTRLLRDLAQSPVSASSDPSLLAVFRDRLLFLATDVGHGREIWLTDGTPAGTHLLADLEPGPASPQQVSAAANERMALLFATTQGSDRDPWIFDGTTLQQLDILPANSGFVGSDPVAFGERIVFLGYTPATGGEPWISDGTVAGTHLLVDTRPGPTHGQPRGWTQLGSLLFFLTAGFAGTELWCTDGSGAGTRFVADLGHGHSPRLTVFDDRVWFAAATPAHGTELWSSDGTPGGTRMLLDLEPGVGSSNPTTLAAVGNQMFARVTVGGMARIAVTDGTAPGTRLLAFAAVDLVGPFAVDARHAVFFEPTLPGFQERFHRTDGTDPGTVLVRTINRSGIWLMRDKPGVDRLLLGLDDGATGAELWTTDATAAGTRPIAEFDPLDALPDLFARIGESLVFAVDDGIHGRELYAAPFVITDDWAATQFGGGCPGATGMVPTIGVRGQARAGATAPFHLELGGAAPQVFAMLAIAFDRRPNPLPGCTLWIDNLTAVVTATTDVAGRASVAVQVPAGFANFRFLAQFAHLEPGAAALGLAATTPGLDVVIGR